MRACGAWGANSKIEGRCRLLSILGDVDEHGAGPAGGGDLEGEPNRRRDIFRSCDEEVVLRDRQSDAGDVHFLKGIGAEHLGGNLAGDGDDGHGVKHGGGDAGDEVRRAGSAGRHAYADASGCAGVAIGHVRRALLVPHQHVPDGKLTQRVVDGQDGAAGITEDFADAFSFERCPHDLRAS